MQWLEPAWAWAFIALLPVVALYLLKKHAKREDVPSLLLWRKTVSRSEVNRPFQKLKNQLLLWLQLLLVVLAALSLMRPAGLYGTQGETVLILDVSASMQTALNGATRMDKAREEALRLLDSMRDTDAVTVIAAGSQLEQLVSRSVDHAEARRAIESVSVQNGASNMDGAVALALAMRRDLPSLGIVVFSDNYQVRNSDVRVVSVGESVPNRSFISLRLSEQPGGLIAFAQVENRGAGVEAEMECYADGVLCDVRTQKLDENAVGSVRFSVPEGARRVMVRFAKPDALPADDVRYAARPEETERRALLVGEGNVFLENALALRENLTVIKASLADAEGVDGYDLYVYDCVLPEALPGTGALMLIAPTREILSIAPGAENEAGAAAFRAGAGESAKPLTEHLLLQDIAVRKYTPLTGGEAVLTSGGDALVSVSENAGRRAAVFGFDLHESNLALKADFPVLVQNLLSYLLPDAAAAVKGANCGETVTLTLDERTASATVLQPGGGEAVLLGGAFDDTDEIGLYTLLEQRDDGGVRETPFALHIPMPESDTMTLSASVGMDGGGVVMGTGREWTSLLLLLALAVLLLEWEVSRRGV